MDPQQAFCPTLDCPARGQVGEGNITSHGRKRARYHCKVCGQTLQCPPRHALLPTPQFGDAHDAGAHGGGAWLSDCGD